MATRNLTPTLAECFREGWHGTPLPSTPPPKPCPFCGVTDMLGLFDLPDVAAYSVECQNCGAEGPSGSSQLEAAALWNGRRQEA